MCHIVSIRFAEPDHPQLLQQAARPPLVLHVTVPVTSDPAMTHLLVGAHYPLHCISSRVEQVACRREGLSTFAHQLLLLHHHGSLLHVLRVWDGTQ